MNTYEQRLKRTLNAVKMEPVDKIPFSYSGPAYVARWSGLTMQQYLNDFPTATDGTIKFLNAHPGIDSIHSPIFTTSALKLLWFSNVGEPGIDIDENDLWQVLEAEVMEFDDYQAILDKGYANWLHDFMAERLGDPETTIVPFLQNAPITTQRVAEEAQVPVMNGLSNGSPFEGFCGGRQLMNFFMDICEEPELVKSALDAAFEHVRAGYKAQLEMAKPLGAWVGGWRAAPELLSHDTFMEFVWPYLKEMILMTIDAGTIPVLHFDSCWDSELETLKELPARKCILMLDGATDIRLAREILDDRMCLLGDVPSSKLAFGTPDECYDYVTKLIDDCGPKSGLIVSSGCDVPLNAKEENVQAIVQATIDYQV